MLVKKKKEKCWWCTPLIPIPALRRQRHSDLCEFEFSPVFIQREFQDNQSYSEKPCLKKKTNKKKKKKDRK